VLLEDDQNALEMKDGLREKVVETSSVLEGWQEQRLRS
jgi:hypothetical protein